MATESHCAKYTLRDLVVSKKRTPYKPTDVVVDVFWAKTGMRITRDESGARVCKYFRFFVQYGSSRFAARFMRKNK